MRKPTLFGSALIAAGSVFLAALLYEPANIVTLFGLKDVLSEASVVILSLMIVAACGIGGVAALRNRVTNAS